MPTTTLPSSSPLPAIGSGIEEVTAAAHGELGAALGFAACRLAGSPGDGRPFLLVTTRYGLKELGTPMLAGLGRLGLEAGRSLIVLAEKEAQALWALDEALRSGAITAGLAVARTPSFLMTKRLAFAAGKGLALGLVLRPRPEADLSAARLRWRIGSLPSAPHPRDARAPGSPRWRADLVRRHDGPPASFQVEWDDAAHGLRLVAGLADHRPAAAREAPAAA